jgi:hypothetical protein
VAPEKLGEAQVGENEGKRALVSLSERLPPDVLKGNASRVEVVAPDAGERQLEARLPYEGKVTSPLLELDRRLQGRHRFGPTQNRFDHALSPERDGKGTKFSFFLGGPGGGARMVQCICQLLAQEKERGREPLRSVSSRRGIRTRVCEALFEQLDRDSLISGVVVEPGESTQRLGASWAGAFPLGRLDEERAGTSGVAGIEVRRARLEAPTVSGLEVPWRRQAKGLLAQLGGSLRRAASARDSGRLVERGRDAGIRLLGTESEVTRPFLGIRNDRGQSAMSCAPPLGSGRRIQSRREQRVREADPLAVQLDQLDVHGLP